MVTVVQRIHHVWCQIDRDLPEEIVALTLQDVAWSRAFKAAARRFYGERNFDGALDDAADREAGRRGRRPPPRRPTRSSELRGAGGASSEVEDGA
jgi:hypothetical protein